MKEEEKSKNNRNDDDDNEIDFLDLDYEGNDDENVEDCGKKKFKKNDDSEVGESESEDELSNKFDKCFVSSSLYNDSLQVLARAIAYIGGCQNTIQQRSLITVFITSPFIFIKYF
jgi:hypothetical protein